MGTPEEFLKLTAQRLSGPPKGQAAALIADTMRREDPVLAHLLANWLGQAAKDAEMIGADNNAMRLAFHLMGLPPTDHEVHARVKSGDFSPHLAKEPT
jgi:hypothetical protein